MEKIKKLVEDFLEYTCLISITDSELYEKYESKLNQSELDYLDTHNKLDYEIERMIKADILYDFIFEQDNIKNQMLNDIDSYGKNSEEYKDIVKIYQKIQKVFPKFEIKECD